jgi:hypothetical protein
MLAGCAIPITRAPFAEGLHALARRDVDRARERLQDPREVALEVVGDEHRHAGRFLDDRLERLQLDVVDLGPLAVRPPARLPRPRYAAPFASCRHLIVFAAAVKASISWPEISANILRSISRYWARLRRELHLDRDRTTGLSTSNGSCGVMQMSRSARGSAAARIARGVGARVLVVAEPALAERLDRAAEADAGVEEPGLPPQID